MALKDRERVERTWRVVAHALAARAAEAASDDGEWARRCLREFFPLPEDSQGDLEDALRSFDLGLGDVDTNLAQRPHSAAPTPAAARNEAANS